MKACTYCGVVKPPSEFPRDRTRPNGRRSNCKACDSVRKAAYYLANAEERKAYTAEWRRRTGRRGGKRTPADSRRLRYGITEAQFLAMLDAQDNRCAICKTELAWPVVDHDHQTGRVRGVLCNPCNRGLGQFGDDVSRLESAAAYLKATV